MVALIPQETVQYPVVASGVINYNDTVGGVALSTVATHDFTLAKLPANALLIQGEVTVVTNWATSTVASLDIGDDDPSDVDPDRYTSSVINLLAAGDERIPLSVDAVEGFVTTVQCNLTAQLIITVGAATAGKLYWYFEYIVLGRAHENIG